MQMAIVVDTNVAVVANGGHPAASKACVSACVHALKQLVSSGQIAVDDGWRIIREYRAYLSEKGQPGVGDVFFRWLLQNIENPRRCVKVKLTPIADPDRRFEEFPNDAAFAGFDREDTKFVAVSNALPRKPTILQGVDGRWRGFAAAFAAAGIPVQFLC